MFGEYKYSNPIKYIIFYVFALKRIVLAVLLIIVEELTSTFLFAFIAVSIASMMYISFVRPFR